MVLASTALLSLFISTEIVIRILLPQLIFYKEPQLVQKRCAAVE